MRRSIYNRRLWLGLFLAALCLAVPRARSETLLYATTSATQSANSMAEFGQTIFTATGTNGGNDVLRCTAAAVDSSAGKIFMVDAAGRRIWTLNEDGSGLALVASVVIGTPTDLALDTVHQRIYFTTSSSSLSSNTIQLVNYSGGSPTVLFTATGTGGNEVSRCTALALDLLNGRVLFSDAGSNALWSLALGGNSLVNVMINTLGTPLDLALDVTNQLVYYVTSSATSSHNSVQRIPYGGGTSITLLAVGSGNNVGRCTGVQFDPTASQLYLSDAGSNTIWSMKTNGSSLAAVQTALPGASRHMGLLPFLELVVSNFKDSGAGSLRQAISETGIPHTIVFSNGLFAAARGAVELGTVGDSTFGPSAFIITNQITIAGPGGSNGVVIARSNGAPAMRLFYVAQTGSLILSNVMLTNGLAQGNAGAGGFQRGGAGGGAGGLGGAILNFGTLDLENSTLAFNQALGGAGGGAGGGGEGSGGGGGGMAGAGGSGGQQNVGGTGGAPMGGLGGTNAGAGLTGGLGGGGGGGGSSLTSGAGAGAGGGGGFGGGGGGGGAYNSLGDGGGVGGNGGNGGFGGGGGGGGGGTPEGTPGVAGFGGGAGGPAADNTGNLGSAGGGGAGLGGAVFNSYGTLTITNCTFSWNSAAGGLGGNFNGVAPNGMGFGGAIFNLDSTLTVLNGTFAYNQADEGGGGICNAGLVQNSSVYLRNTILADTPSGASDYLSTNMFGAANTNFGVRNLIQANDGFAGGIVSSADPRLTALQNNGGPTWTHALMNGSPAIGAGNESNLPATDQRGYPRLAEGTGTLILETVDLGAVEDGLVRLDTVPQTELEILRDGFELSLTGETNRNYVIEYSTDLANWAPVSTVTVPTAGVITISPPALGGGRPVFYRASAQPSSP